MTEAYMGALFASRAQFTVLLGRSYIHACLAASLTDSRLFQRCLRPTPHRAAGDHLCCTAVLVAGVKRHSKLFANRDMHMLGQSLLCTPNPTQLLTTRHSILVTVRYIVLMCSIESYPGIA